MKIYELNAQKLRRSGLAAGGKLAGPTNTVPATEPLLKELGYTKAE